MFGDMKKAMGMMKQLGISQEPVEADRVIIETKDKQIIIDEPQVVKIKMSGQESFQISGKISEKTGISEEDIKTVMEKTGCQKEEAAKALEDSQGDLAEAILGLA
jgi:nascent polypeptide-associated complex subunit alpha